jgi:hypothetical protein
MYIDFTPIFFSHLSPASSPPPSAHFRIVVLNWPQHIPPHPFHIASLFCYSVQNNCSLVFGNARPSLLLLGNNRHLSATSFKLFVVCMYKGWAIKLALAPRPLMIYCASPLAAAMIITSCPAYCTCTWKQASIAC